MEDEMTQVITDLSQFGRRELRMAGELLLAYCNNPLRELGDGVHVAMNTGSGFVFLSDEDFNVAMMNGNKLEMFWTCHECGNEGFAEDINWNADQHLCGKCAKPEEDAA